LALYRLPDRISIGVLARTFTPALLDEVIDAAGAREVRYRRLPARLVVVFMLACWLFTRSGYGLVMSRLADAHALEGPGWRDWEVPSSGAIAKARARLGQRVPCPRRPCGRSLASMVQASWQTFATGSPNTLIVVDVVDPMVIWVAGGGFDAPNNGTVVRTVNGGQTWQNVTAPDGTAHVFRDVEAVDANHAVVLASDTGNDGNGVFKPSRISVTANGGHTWQTVFDANLSDFYNSVGFYDRRRGLAFSDPVGGKFPILETGNGGHKWKLADPGGLPIALPSEFGRATGTSLVAVGPSNAWFGTNPEDDPGARVFHTQDGGTTWTFATTPIPGGPAGIVSLSFRDRMNGLAVGGSAPTGQNDVGLGVAARTSDGGATWFPVGPLHGFRNGVAWIPGLADTAVAVGHRGSDVSDDGGNTWTQFDDSLFLLGVACRSANACWAVGRGGIAAKLTI